MVSPAEFMQRFLRLYFNQHQNLMNGKKLEGRWLEELWFWISRMCLPAAWGKGGVFASGSESAAG